MNEIRICAGIVTYNPNIYRLRENIKGIIEQVEQLYIYDNNSENKEEIKKLCDEFKIILKISEKNMGIAVGFNQIMECAIDYGSEWVILLDQDTVCPQNMVDEYKKCIGINRVALIAPVLIDKRRASKQSIKNEKIGEVIKVVSSGSMVSTDIYRKVGKFEEILFIDMVDYEYCMRIRINGYKILQLPSVVLDQEFGNVRPSRHQKFFKKIYEITKFPLISHLEYVPVFSADRVTFSFRNWVYCLKKYSLYSKKIKCIYQIILYGMINYIRTGLDYDYLKAYLRGIKEGIKMKPVKYRTECIHKIDLM